MLARRGLIAMRLLSSDALPGVAKGKAATAKPSKARAPRKSKESVANSKVTEGALPKGSGGDEELQELLSFVEYAKQQGAAVVEGFGKVKPKDDNIELAADDAILIRDYVDDVIELVEQLTVRMLEQDRQVKQAIRMLNAYQISGVPNPLEGTKRD